MSADIAPSEARRPSNANDYATPQPSRTYPNGGPASTSTRTLHQVSSSSLSNQTTVQASPSTARPANSGQTTVESALAQANGSYEAALAHVVEDRNNIHNQNAMLWKHFEKIKVTAAGLKKDLDRIRGERDRALTRIQQLTGEEPRARPSNQRAPSLDTLSSLPVERPAPPLRHLSDTGMLGDSICFPRFSHINHSQ